MMMWEAEKKRMNNHRKTIKELKKTQLMNRYTTNSWIIFYVLYAIIFLYLSTEACADTVTEEDWVTATLILEAGGEYAEGSMEAVHEVIIHRSKNRGLSLTGVVLQPKQFSCWNDTERRPELLAHAREHPRWEEAREIVESPKTDYSKGATHYHADRVYPYWADSLDKTVQIGNHVFYE